MVINALNSGDNSFMADFEGMFLLVQLIYIQRLLKDSSAPTFSNLINGQINLRDAIDFEVGGKRYKLNENPAVLIVRYVCLASLCSFHT